MKIERNKIINEKLENVDIYKEDDIWYIHLTYKYEDETGVYEYHIPKVSLPFTDFMPAINDIIADTPRRFSYIYKYPDIPIPGELKMCNASEFVIEDPNGVKHACKNIYAATVTVKDKIHEMTLEEIEKKLGFKVKIVSKEE